MNLLAKDMDIDEHNINDIKTRYITKDQLFNNMNTVITYVVLVQIVNILTKVPNDNVWSCHFQLTEQSLSVILPPWLA